MGHNDMNEERFFVSMCITVKHNALDRRHVSAQNVAIFWPFTNVRTDHCTAVVGGDTCMVCRHVLRSSLRIINCIKNTKITIKPWDVYLRSLWVLGDRLSVLGSMVRTLKCLCPASRAE
jgi:hypothetical protein